MKNALDKAVAAERRRCKRMGYIFDQPAGDLREDDYRVGDLVKLGNVRGLMATYRVGPTGRIARVQDGVSKWLDTEVVESVQ